jgi:hypothetical protein
VLVAASGGPADGGYSAPPVGFFRFDGSRFIAEPTIPNAGNDTSGSISLLVLPTGQVLAVDGSLDVEIFTPDDGGAVRPWSPVVESVSDVLTPGHTYRLDGLRLNGVSQGSAFGDELQNATNYPLVRITNVATGHVFYSRTHDHTSMSVSWERESSTHFDVPAAQEHGPSRLEVIANGVPSQPVAVSVE